MKQIFYTGLLALTVAFGMTSCDKDNNGGDIQLSKSEVDAGIASKVTFSEDGSNIVSPKLKSGDQASKSHTGYAHAYSPAPQVLSIIGDNGDYTGSYDAGIISTLDPASIILANGDYVATSSNVSNSSEGVVGSFLPYTSTKSFNLSESGNITLVATLERGFLIVNAQAEALDANRVQSAKIFLDAGDGATPTSFDLIKDTDGDYYAYLEAGSYDVEVTYLLNGVEKVVRGTKAIANGLAYTLNLSLTADTEILLGTESDVSSETFIESEIPADSPAPAFANEDNDLLDTVSRVVTSTFTTTDGDRDADQTPSIVYGEWIVIDTNNDLGVGESGDGLGEGGSSTGDESDVTFVDRTYSVWTPAFGTEIANFMQTRTVSNANANVDPEGIILALEREVVVTPSGGGTSPLAGTEAAIERSINDDDGSGVAGDAGDDLLDTLTRTITADTVYTASFNLGSHTVDGAAPGAWSIVIDNDAVIADTPDSGAWAVNADGTAAIFVITQGGNAFDTDAPVAQAAPDASLLTAGTQYVAGDDFADGSVAIELIPVVAALWTVADGVYSNTDYPNYSYTILDFSSLPGGLSGFATTVTKDGTITESLNGSGDTADVAHSSTRANIIADQG